MAGTILLCGTVPIDIAHEGMVRTLPVRQEGLKRSNCIGCPAGNWVARHILGYGAQAGQ